MEFRDPKKMSTQELRDTVDILMRQLLRVRKELSQREGDVPPVVNIDYSGYVSD